MRISDWSSDVCSSDLIDQPARDEDVEIAIETGRGQQQPAIVTGNIRADFLAHQQAIASAGLGGYGPSPIAVLGRFGIVTVQEEPVVTEASCGDYHAIRAYGLAIQYDAAHTTVFVCVQRGHAAAPRNVDIAAVDLPAQQLGRAAGGEKV